MPARVRFTVDFGAQNLYLIGALEQRLRHLLGDRELVRRDLILAAG